MVEVVPSRHLFIHYFKWMNKLAPKIDPISTILTINICFIILYLITRWHLLLYFSILIGIGGLSNKTISIFINNLWIRMVRIFSCIARNLVLTLIYFIVLTPLAYLCKAFNCSNQLNLRNNKRSLFLEKHKNFNSDSFHKMW